MRKEEPGKKNPKGKFRDILEHFPLRPLAFGTLLAIVPGYYLGIKYIQHMIMQYITEDDKRPRKVEKDIRKALGKVERNVIQMRTRMHSINESIEKMKAKRREVETQVNIYRTGWVDPKGKSINKLLSKLAKIKRESSIAGSYSAFDAIIMSGVVDNIQPVSSRDFGTRSIGSILSDDQGTREEKVRLMISITLANGGSAYYVDADGCPFAYLLVKERATKEDIEEAKELFRDNVVRDGYRRTETIHGRMFGKDYYIAWDPVQRSIGVVSEGLLSGRMELQRFEPQDYR
jgi:hypothetical protein